MHVTTSDAKSLLVALVVGGAFLYFDATICPTAGLFGVPCPSCGLSRATLALLSGRLEEAYALHPGVFVVWPYLFAAGLVLRRRTASAAARAVGITGIVLLGALVVLWGARFAGHFGGPVQVHPWGELLRGVLRR